jgi:hypothetical protein
MGGKDGRRENGEEKKGKRRRKGEDEKRKIESG